VTDALTVALDPEDPGRSRLHRSVLASLPARFCIVAGLPADVVLISGDDPGWRGRANDAFASRASAIMLSGSSAMTADAVAGLAAAAAETGVLAAADVIYASARSWTEALPSLIRDLPDCAVLDSIVTAPEPVPGMPAGVVLRSALIEQFALLRPLIGEPGELHAVHTGACEYVLAGQQQELAVTVSGALSAASGHGLDLALVGASRRWHARFAVGALAAPVTISVWDSDGERTWPQVYESGHRTAWLRLHGALQRAEPLLYSASQLADDLGAAQAALAQIPV
jgi:hypothetical protein